MKLDDMILTLEELKRLKNHLPYCVYPPIEKPMNVEEPYVVIEDLLENLITLIEFVKKLPSDLEQYKEKGCSVDYDSSLFEGAMNHGIDKTIRHIEEFINTIENSKK